MRFKIEFKPGASVELSAEEIAALTAVRAALFDTEAFAKLKDERDLLLGTLLRISREFDLDAPAIEPIPEGWKEYIAVAGDLAPKMYRMRQRGTSKWGQTMVGGQVIGVMVAEYAQGNFEIIVPKG